MIDFITAHDGGIKMYANNSFVGYGKTANNIAYILVTKGLAAEVFGGNSMNFANEEGFDTLDGATKLFNEALGIYNWKVNGVA